MSVKQQGAIILEYKGIKPEIAGKAFIAPGAAVIGDVKIGDGSSVWFNVTVRGDVNYVRIGRNTNIQDGTVCHVTSGIHPLVIGNRVTIGHNATVHGCTLKDESFVGMGATVMDGAVVESGAMVAAGALVAPDKIVPSGEVWAGVPAKYMRPVSDDEAAYLKHSASRYSKLAREYLGGEEAKFDEDEWRG